MTLTPAKYSYAAKSKSGAKAVESEVRKKLLAAFLVLLSISLSSTQVGVQLEGCGTEASSVDGTY